jgi:hypothetical protein
VEHKALKAVGKVIKVFEPVQTPRVDRKHLFLLRPKQRVAGLRNTKVSKET